MAKAAVDIVSYLPSPATKANAGSADLLDDQLFAWGCGPSIVIAEVPQLQVLLVLHGEHRDALVTAVKWAPDCHSRDLKSHTHVRLASGDSEGRVVVWDVRAGQPASRLSDRMSDSGTSSGLTAANGSAGGGPVAGLEWVASQPCLLAVLLVQGGLMLWDTRGGSVVWRRDLMSGGELCCCLARDPLDATRLAVCGSAGALTLVSLVDPQAGQVDLKQYRVSIAPSNADTLSTRASSQQASSSSTSSGSPPTFQALFPSARDLLFLTLAREVIVFDLELGVPAATIGLPNSRPAFAWLLGVYGRGTSHGLGDEGGADVVVAVHVEGSISMWTRALGELRYSNSGWFRLTPTPVKGASTPSTHLVAARAKVWTHQTWGSQGLQGRPGVSSGEDVTRRLGAYLVPDRITPDASGGRDIFGGITGGRPSTSQLKASPAPGSDPHQGSSGSRGTSLLVVSVSSDGRVWQWQAALPHTPQRRYDPSSPTLQLQGFISPASPSAAPPASAPTLVAMRQLLPLPVTCAAMFPLPVLTSTTTSLGEAEEAAWQGHAPAATAPVAAPGHGAGEGGASGGGGGGATGAQAGGVVGQVVMLGAALTTGGQLQVFTIHRSQLTPLACHVTLSLSVHRDMTVSRGLRWLGCTPRLITFSADKLPPGGGGGGGGWRNTVAITDLRTRRTTPFRELAGEPHRLTSIRASPSGFHVLLRLQDAPTELWAVGIDPPIKLMSLDVDWSAPEWMATSDPTQQTPIRLQDLLHWPTATPPPPVADSAGHHNHASATATTTTTTTLPLNLPTPLNSTVFAQASAQHAQGVATPPTSKPATPTAAAGTELPAVVDPSVPVPYKNPASSWQVAVNAATALAPEECVVYTYDEGIKSGVLRIRGRSVVNDDKVKRPRFPQEEAPRFHATAMAGWGSVVVMGDPEGRLAVWSTASGAFSMIHTGCGVIRRLFMCPAPHPTLYTAPDKTATIAARVACMFGDGTFGVYELSARGTLRAGHASPLVTYKAVGRVSDMSWLNLPCDDGGGSLLLVVTETGSLAVLDVSQALDRRPSPLQRSQALRTLLDTPHRLAPSPPPPPPAPPAPPPVTTAKSFGDMLGDEVPLMPTAPLPDPIGEGCRQVGAAAAGAHVTHVVLAPAPALSCALLLPRSWLLLLRLLLQQGIQLHTLRALAGLDPEEGPRGSAGSVGSGGGGGGGGGAGVSEAVEELLTLLPTATHKQLLLALGSKAPGSTPRAPAATSPFLVAASSSSAAPVTLAAPPIKDMMQQPHGPSEISLAPSPSQAAAAAGGGDDSGSTSMGLGIMRAMVGEAYKMVRSTTQALSGAVPDAPSVPGKSASSGEGDGSSHAGRRQFSSRYHTDLVGLIRHLARVRAGGQLLHPGEWDAYRANLAAAQGLSSLPPSTAALHHTHTHTHAASPPLPPLGLTGAVGVQAAAAAAAGGGGGGSTEARVRPLCGCLVVAAQVAGDSEEAAFWAHLPATLQSVRDLQDSLAPRHAAPLYQQQPPGSAGPAVAPGRAQAVHISHEAPPPLRVAHQQQQQQQGPGGSTHHPSAGLRLTASHGGSPERRGQRLGDDGGSAVVKRTRLWDEDVALAEAQERALWHESLSRSVFQNSQDLQERRMLEYVVLGDFQTAVAFLLASSPEVSPRYYRDALVTAALAAAANARPGTGARNMGSALQLQAAKVLSAHASSIGDPLLGVPLHCAAGLYTEAVTLLQECDLWRYAANLTAHALTGGERGAALERWARHVAGREGSMWRAAGILTAAGCCREALHMLQESGRPDSAAAFLAACHAAGLTQTMAVPASPRAGATGATAGGNGTGTPSSMDGSGGAALAGTPQVP